MRGVGVVFGLPWILAARGTVSLPDFCWLRNSRALHLCAAIPLDPVLLRLHLSQSRQCPLEGKPLLLSAEDGQAAGLVLPHHKCPVQKQKPADHGALYSPLKYHDTNQVADQNGYIEIRLFLLLLLLFNNKYINFLVFNYVRQKQEVTNKKKEASCQS